MRGKYAYARINCKRPSVTNSSHGVKILISSKEKVMENYSYKRRNYEAVADSAQSEAN